MKTKSLLLFGLFLLIASKNLYAHALWIETQANGKIGQIQEVKIFYGEYAHNLIEDFEGWYSDVEDFKLVLTGPGNEQTILECDSTENYFTTTFTPEKEGIYTLAISHSAKDLGGDYVYQFNTSKEVYVGKSLTGQKNEPAENEIYLKPDVSNTNKVGKEIKGSVFIDGKTASGIKVEVVSPQGWVKTLESDSEGSFQFKADWKGKYLVEASYTEDTKGEHYGNKYEHIWKCATYVLVIE